MSATRIRFVGGTAIGPVHRATCRCGAVELELLLPHGIVDPHRSGSWPITGCCAVVCIATLGTDRGTK